MVSVMVFTPGVAAMALLVFSLQKWVRISPVLNLSQAETSVSGLDAGGEIQMVRPNLQKKRKKAKHP